MIGGLLGLVGGQMLSTGIQGAINYGLQKDAQSFNADQAALSRQFASSENQANRDFNALEAQKSRDWQTQMSNTAYQRQVEDMKAAGLNVGAIGSGGGASSGSSTAASYSGSNSASMASSAASAVSSPDFGKAVGAVLRRNGKELAASYLANSSKTAERVADAISDGELQELMKGL